MFLECCFDVLDIHLIILMRHSVSLLYMYTLHLFRQHHLLQIYGSRQLASCDDWSTTRVLLSSQYSEVQN